jgi:ABC-2 type transport system permease protein
MNNLIKTEWLKIRKYPAFWWMACIILLSYPGINFMFYKIYQDQLHGNGIASQILSILGNPFTFPEIWHTAAYTSSIFVFIPAIVVIMFITNEYTYKTHRQNIIDGWSRNQFMTAKLVDVLLITFIITVMNFFVSLVIGYLNIGTTPVNMWGETKYIPLFFLQTFSQLSLAFLIAFLIRKAFIALGIFIFYKMILENILIVLARVYANDIGRFLPFEVSNRTIPLPTFLGRTMDHGKDKWYQTVLEHVNQHIVLTILLTTIVWAICFRINKRRDL